MNSIRFSKEVKTVTELTKAISQLLETRFHFVSVTGEISGLRRPFSGHYYFTLKDAHSQIRAVLFKNQQAYLSQEPRDGQHVICEGRITVYEPRGEYQIIVDAIDFHGTGKLQIAFDPLKHRLKQQGFFDPQRKRPIPEHINKIVLITSPSGAAVHDFLTICRRRRASLLVQLLPVRVQGEGAAREIVGAIERARDLHPDVIVLCRGGGSMEDLWSFNEESVARAIYQATIPIVTGIGHETDFTIADFCADLRGATPTGAAELLITDANSQRERIANLCARLIRTFSWQLDSVDRRLKRVNRFLSTFDAAFSQPTLKLDSAFNRLAGSISLRLERLQQRCATAENKLRGRSPIHAIHFYQSQTNHLSGLLASSSRQLLRAKLQRLQKAAAVLDSLSPLATLARGYAIVSRDSGDGAGAMIVTDAEQVREQDRIGVRLHRGHLQCLVAARFVPAKSKKENR